MEELHTSKTLLFENNPWEDAYLSSYSYPPGSAPGHKHQKLAKESGIFQSLSTFNFVLFTKRQSQNGRHGTMPPPPYIRSCSPLCNTIRNTMEKVRLACVQRYLLNLSHRRMLVASSVGVKKAICRSSKKKRTQIALIL